MFVVLVYDVNCKRISKVNKICKKYLRQVQRSVFEGDITEAKLKRMKNELKSCAKAEDDSICIYELGSSKYAYKSQLGLTENNDTVI